MDNPSPRMRDLARRVLAASEGDSDSQVPPAMLVSENLRASLTRFAGSDGFAALLRRALSLASAEMPELQSLEVGPTGSLDGFEKLTTADGPRNVVSEAGVVVTTHLLELLVTFIGEPLTLRLVREAWPDISLDDWHSQIEVDG